MWTKDQQELIDAGAAVLTFIVTAPFVLLLLREVRSRRRIGGRQINFGRVAMLFVGVAACHFALLTALPSSFSKLRLFLTASITFAVAFVVGRLVVIIRRRARLNRPARR